jgi:hypothetical protein
MGYHVLIVRHGRLGGFLVQAMANAVMFGWEDEASQRLKQSFKSS